MVGLGTGTRAAARKSTVLELFCCLMGTVWMEITGVVDGVNQVLSLIKSKVELLYTLILAPLSPQRLKEIA